jgi:predicted RNA-binding Zn-ribbon protein involved in translation (DUF1610 family)
MGRIVAEGFAQFWCPLCGSTINQNLSRRDHGVNCLTTKFSP